MSRVRYEIGARGSDESTSALRRALIEQPYGYGTGRYAEENIKSASMAKWLGDETVTEFTRRLSKWCAEWSDKYPDLEVFWFLTEHHGRDEGVLYATFCEGEFHHGATLIRHEDFQDEFGECDCTARKSYYNKYPTETPFSDCPVRLNPPTAWAVENIMYADEYIGRRR